MDFPLTLNHILERAGTLFRNIEVVSRRPDRSLSRYTYGDFYRRARRLAAVYGAWRDGWELKVHGYIDLIRAYLPVMKARKSGVIVNIIGAGGERVKYNYAAGGSGNAALIALTRAGGRLSHVRFDAINRKWAAALGCRLPR